MIVSYAAAMHWSYSARAWLGVFASMSDGRVLMRHELTWIRTSPEDAVSELIQKCEAWGIGIPRNAAAKGLQPLRYLVAQAAIFPQTKSGGGKTISEKFSSAGVPMRCADMDAVNGWDAVRSWLKTRTHRDPSTNPPTDIVSPSLIVHPDCKLFLRTFPTLVSDEKEPDIIVETTDAYPALGLRHYAMSRPAPADKVPDPPPPKGSVYYDVKKIRRSTDRPRLGADNVI